MAGERGTVWHAQPLRPGNSPFSAAAEAVSELGYQALYD